MSTTIPHSRPEAVVRAAAARVQCTVADCAAPEGQPCAPGGAVHLARIARACRARHVTPDEWAAVLKAAGVIFTPRTLIGGSTQACAA